MKVDIDGNLDLTPRSDLSPLWLAIPSVLGALLIGMAIYVSVSWNWQGIWPDVFLQLGSALFLAAALFWFERRFTRAVSAAAYPLCDLSPPPTPIAKIGHGWDFEVQYGCGHRPRHRWNSAGKRLPDDTPKEPAVT
jgi:hypothetical protein